MEPQATEASPATKHAPAGAPTPLEKHAPAGAPTPLEKQEKIKKTADRAAYMRAYRLANLEKCREQDRRQYHANKPTNPEAKMKQVEIMVLNALAKYPEILNNM
jgi:hypothetical protein